MTNPAAQAAAQTLVDGIIQHGKVPGAIVWAGSRDGTIAHACAGKLHAADPASPPVELRTPYWLASCTKLVTIIALLQLVEQGKVDLSASADRYVPSIAEIPLLRDDGTLDPAGPTRLPTVHELATHTAGMSYPFFDEKVVKHCEAERLSPFDLTLRSLHTPFAHQPGETWEYSYSIDWCGKIVEAVSSLSLEDYFRRHIFTPLGIEGMTFLPEGGALRLPKSGTSLRHPETGEVTEIPHPLPQDSSKIEFHSGGAGLYGNADEYGRILVALLNRGTHPSTGQAILRPETVELLFRPQLTPAQLEGLNRPSQSLVPLVSNSYAAPPGIEQQWSYGGCVWTDPPNGRGKGCWWAGIMNHFWWISLERGTCGMVQVNQFPFYQPDDVVVPFYFDFEPKVHQAVDPRRSGLVPLG